MRLCRFLSGTSDHGLALNPTSAFNRSLSETTYGDASLDTAVVITGLVGQINGATDLMLGRGAFVSLDLDRLLHGVRQLCCDNKGVVALIQGEGILEDKDTGRKDASDPISSQGRVHHSLTPKPPRCQQTS